MLGKKKKKKKKLNLKVMIFLSKLAITKFNEISKLF